VNDFKEVAMLKTLCTLTLLAVLAASAVGQNTNPSPSATLKENQQAVAYYNLPKPKPVSQYEPPFCPPDKCLYYAGDFESTYSGANGLFNENDTGAQLEGEAWVGVKPVRNATVTGVTFVEFFTSGFSGTNPTPFAVQVGIKPGQAGTTVCSATGNATLSIYGEGQFPMYSYTVKKLSKSCHLKKGSVYYVNMLPISSNGYGYVTNLPPKAPPNHHGWKNDLNDCYFNGAAFGSDYVTCDSQGDFSELSIALTGKE
jgi:hypothetical protein